MTHPAPAPAVDADVAALREALNGDGRFKPTPGPWIDDRRLSWHQPNTVVQAECQAGTYQSVMDVRLSDLGSFTCTTGKSEQEWVNAAYIAACSPDRLERILTALSAAQARAEAVEKDAERYRWVRRGQHWSVINGIGDDLRADQLDAAIDAAITPKDHK